MKQPEERNGSGQNGAVPAKSGRKPMKVLSTSLGVALAANLLAVPAACAEGGDAAGKPQPKLVEWSTEAVKGYYDPGIDWNLALPDEKKPGGTGAAGQSPASGSGAGAGGGAAGPAAYGGGGTNTVVVHSGGGGGFGWDDLLLYHLLFNNGGVYSTSSWSQSHNTVYAGGNQAYQARYYTPETFQNKPVAGSAVRPPQTAASSGSFSTGKSSASTSTATAPGGTTTSTSPPGTKAPSTTTSSGSFSTSSSKSSSASSGSIGGRSSGFSSSSGS